MAEMAGATQLAGFRAVHGVKQVFIPGSSTHLGR
jgi:hypothetical protein